MSFNDIILWIMAVGILLAAADKICKNRLGLGTRLDEGIHTMGPLALGMVGIVCLAPTLSKRVKPVVLPMCAALGIDPALFGSILANDMGGYSLATELAVEPQAGLYFGLIVASMLGCTLVFSIPVGLGIIDEENHPYFSEGLLIGLAALPVGCIVGGIVAGFDMRLLLVNTVPILIFAFVPAVGLKRFPNGTIKVCTVLGRIIQAVAYVGLAAAAFEHITGVTLIPDMAPVEEGMSAVAEIAIVLMGAFPMLELLCRALKRPFNALGGKIGLDSNSIAGMIITLANSVPVFGMMKDMNKRGIVINTAWLVSATAALGDHLGFTAGIRPDMIGAMIAGKLTAGLIAAIAAYFATRKQ